GIKLMDFMTSLMKLYNLYLIQDPINENKFIIEPYSSFYKDIITLNRNKAINWTDKVDFKNYKLSTNINIPKAYKFSYTEDNDMVADWYKNRYNKTYGEITINDSQGYTATKEINLIFSPTININHSQDLKMLPVIYKADGFLQGKKKPFQSKLRILYNNGIRQTGLYPIHYKGIQVTTKTNYNYCSMFRVDQFTDNITDTLLFDLPLEYLTTDNITENDSITIYSKYHKRQIQDLTDNNLIIMECNIYLNENDISNLDFQIPIYIQTKYGNSYFKLLEVEYTNSNVASLVKMMKIV